MDLHLVGLLPGEYFSEAARIAASALVAGLWQGMLLCASTGVVLMAVPKSTARLRFLVWIAVFCASVAMPFLHLAGGVPAGPASAGPASQWVFDARWSYVLAAVWVIAGAYRAGELVLQGLGLRMLWKSAVPVANGTLTALEMPLTVGRRTVEICTSSQVDRPSVIGFLAPRILVPEWLFAQLSATELNHIVLHEMEHLRRRDDWMNLLQKIGLVLLPLNPALFWVDHRLSTERELACDDGVLERTKTPRAYAASLTSIAERRLQARRSSRLGALALAATGLLRRRSELGQRIESILARKAPVNPAFAGAMAAMLVAGIVGTAAGLMRAPQLVSFGAGDDGRERGISAAAALAGPPASVRALPVADIGHVPSRAEFQNVSFYPPAKRENLRVKAAVRRSAARPSDPEISSRLVPAPAQPRPFIVLTSWQDSPVSRVVIEMPDGRFLVAPYAAVPTQAGWLIVQL